MTYPIVKKLREPKEWRYWNGYALTFNSTAPKEAAAIIEQLAKALWPFDKECARYDKLVLGEDIDHWRLTNTELTLGDLRRAREALRKLKGE